MEFYKKIVRSKDTASILSEKEYKCVSLQAITNEAIKENNKRRLKELVEEVNGHLTDLRAINIDKDMKNKERCENLIEKFEECLMKICDNGFSNLQVTITEQFQGIKDAVDTALKVNNLEELKRLAERMERNIAIVKEIPEVKAARNAKNGNAHILDIVNKYTSMLNDTLAYINKQSMVIGEPVLVETSAKHLIEKVDESETSQVKSNKIPLNEVEEKLRLMRQKRLNRLSTFVNQQTKLAEQRSRENSPKGSAVPENANEIVEKVENKTALQSIGSLSIMKPSLYGTATQEKLTKSEEHKVSLNTEEKEQRKMEEKSQSRFVSTLRTSFGKAGVTVCSIENKIIKDQTCLQGNNPQLPPRKSIKDDKEGLTQHSRDIIGTQNSVGKSDAGKQIGQARNQDQASLPPRSSMEDHKKDTTLFSRNAIGARKSFGKDEVTKSLAEKQIDKARNQVDQTRTSLKSSNSSSRSSPPRTPTQIRKIFNSINSCVLGTSSNRSIEDLPSEFNSQFEKELKTLKLKSTKRQGSFKEQQTGEQKQETRTQEQHFVHLKSTNILNKQDSAKLVEVPPPLPPKRYKSPIEKPQHVTGTPMKPNDSYSNVQIKIDEKPKKPLIEKSASQSQISFSLNKEKESDTLDTTTTETTTKNPRRTSLDPDLVVLRCNEPELISKEPTDCTITIKRNSSSIDQPLERYSFTTFRSSSDSIKDELAVSNPSHSDIQLKNERDDNSTSPTKLTRHNSLHMDAMMISAKARQLSDFKYNSLDFVIEETKRKSRRRRPSSNNTNKFIALEPVITKLEYIIGIFRGLKIDEDYHWLDKLLSKYYVKVNEVPTATAFDKVEKNNLLERLRKANRDLERKANSNQLMLKLILEEQVASIGEKYGLV